jgi:perosamine synthetase
VIPVIRPLLGAEEAAAAAEAITSGWIAQGPRVAEFEAAFAAATGSGHAVAVSSCTAALHLTMIAAGVQAGDEVIAPSMSFIATANAARYVGARVVFADIEPDTLNITPDTVAPLLTERTRAVILVDQAGVPADLDAMRKLCDPLGIAVVEDAACAAGTTYRGRPAGAGAALATFSFHPRKLLTTGEGGMITTPDLEVAARLRRLREHGMSVSAAARHTEHRVVIERYGEVGYNYRMTDIQAAIGLVQLRRLPEIIERRRELARRYQRLLGQIPGLRTITDPEFGATNFQSFWVALAEDFPVSRNDLLQMLAEAGISARRGIMAAHLEPAYADQVYGVQLPVTEQLSASTLILPLFHDLTTDEQDQVVAVIATASEMTPRAAYDAAAGLPAVLNASSDSALGTAAGMSVPASATGMSVPA